MSIKNVVAHNSLPLTLSRLVPIHYQSKAGRLLYHSSFYRKLITNSQVSEITTVHDFLHQKHSSTPINKIIHNLLKFSAVKRAHGIICVSNNTLIDLKKYCPPKKLQKIAVIYNGVNNDYTPLYNKAESEDFFKTIHLSDKYILFVGARSKYKNFDFVTQLLTHLPAYKLVVVGNVFTEKEKAAIDKNLHDRIVVANSIPNNQLNILYNRAHALLYPSYYEGFGFPVVEAMKAGCPVISLNLTSIPEVAGGAALLFDDLNVNDFVQAIKFLENKDARAEVIQKGLQNAKRFSWDKCIKETTDFYKEVYGDLD